MTRDGTLKRHGWGKPAPARRDRSGEFDSVVIERTPARMAQHLDAPTVTVKPAPAKIEQRKVQSIRDSARDEECLIRLPDCPRDRSMTIWSHNRHQRAGKGGALKAIDWNGCFGCTHCDAAYDGQRPLPEGMTAEAVELAWYHAHAESLVLLARKGLL